MQVVRILIGLMYCNCLFSAEDSAASRQIVESKLLVTDIVNSAVFCGQSAPVSILTHFPIDWVHEALPEDSEKRKEALTCLMHNSAINRHRVTANALGQIDQMLADLCCRITFDAWDRIEPATLNVNPILCRQAVAALALRWPQQRFEQFTFNCIGDKKVNGGKKNKKIVYWPELLKVCLLTSQNPALCTLTPADLSDGSLFECCLSKLFSDGNISGEELEALCSLPSEQEFNLLLSRLKSSYKFKCAVMQGILRHELSKRCVTEHPRAVLLHEIVQEMDTRFNRWEQQIPMRPLKEIYRDRFKKISLDDVYHCLYSIIEDVLCYRSCAATVSKLWSEMLRSAYLNNEVSGKRRDSNSHVRDVLARLLMSMYYIRDFPIMPNERLCPENPGDKRTLFYAALMGASDLPRYELIRTDFFDFCCDLPDAVFDDIVDKLSQSPEVKEWYANSVMQGYGRKFHHMLSFSLDPEMKKRHQRFKQLIKVTEGEEALKKYLSAANLKSFEAGFCRKPLQEAFGPRSSSAAFHSLKATLNCWLRRAREQGKDSEEAKLYSFERVFGTKSTINDIKRNLEKSHLKACEEGVSFKEKESFVVPDGLIISKCMNTSEYEWLACECKSCDREERYYLWR